MNWLECLIYGLVSGFTEFLPVSSQAHQAIFLRLFGGEESGWLSLFLHTGMLAAVFIGCRGQMGRLYREMRLAQIPRKRRRRNPDPGTMIELSMLKAIATVLMAGFLLYIPASWRKMDLNIVALFLLLNGLMLYLPILFSTGNKDARSMSRLDAVIIGLGGTLSMLPGMSAVGTMSSVCSIRGADREKTLQWVMLLLVPILACLIGFDIRFIIMGAGAEIFGLSILFGCLLAGVAACIGSLLAIQLMRFISVHNGYSGFAFYSWGAALFAFILYLTN